MHALEESNTLANRDSSSRHVDNVTERLQGIESRKWSIPSELAGGLLARQPVVIALSGLIEESRSAEMTVSKLLAVARFSTGSGFEPGASSAVTNRWATGAGAVVLR
jgi:hypothetical protein